MARECSKLGFLGSYSGVNGPQALADELLLAIIPRHSHRTVQH